MYHNIKTVLLVLALFGSTVAYAGRKLHVLFIGNSYTGFNNLPLLAANVASSMGDTLIYDSFIGYSFQSSQNDVICKALIKSAKWDYVVLQEQSRMPAMQTNIFYGSSYYYACKLDSLVQDNDPCTNPVFYMTWGYKHGDSIYCSYDPNWPAWCTYESMDSLINLRYRSYADTTLPPQQSWPFGTVLWTSGPSLKPIRPSQVSPVGAVWNYIRKNHPSIELYHPDGNHPSVAGSYAGALTFYTALFRRDASASSFNHILSAADANAIKTSVKKVVYDSMSKWYIGVNDLRADFSVASMAGNTVTFANSSTYANAYTWYFGDGSTSVAAQPTHSYTTAGTYVVRLVASRDGCSDTSVLKIITYPSGIISVTGDDGIKIYPNPAGDKLYVDIPFEHAVLKIVNTLGLQVQQHSFGHMGENMMELAGVPAGIYTLIINDGQGNTHYEKILKQ